MDDEINLRAYFEVIKKRWKLVVMIMLLVILMVGLYTIRQKPVYQASITIFVRNNDRLSSSNLGALGALAGINLPQTGGVDDLVSVLGSEFVAAQLVTDLNLRQRVKGWNNMSIPDHQLALAVRAMIVPPKVIGNLIELRVNAEDPGLAADLANGFYLALSHCWNKINYTQVKKQREYIESQLPQVEQNLRTAEEKYKSFNLLYSQSSGSLSGQMTANKALGFNVASLAREVEIQNNIYILLRQEYELKKLEESKEIMPFTLLDKAYCPKYPIKSNLKLNLAVGMVFGLLFGCVSAFILEYWRK